MFIHVNKSVNFSRPKIKELIEKGTLVIMDRYAFSGVAFTAAKKVCMKNCFLMIFNHCYYYYVWFTDVCTWWQQNMIQSKIWAALQREIFDKHCVLFKSGIA